MNNTLSCAIEQNPIILQLPVDSILDPLTQSALTEIGTEFQCAIEIQTGYNNLDIHTARLQDWFDFGKRLNSGLVLGISRFSNLNLIEELVPSQFKFHVNFSDHVLQRGRCVFVPIIDSPGNLNEIFRARGHQLCQIWNWMTRRSTEDPSLKKAIDTFGGTVKLAPVIWGTFSQITPLSDLVQLAMEQGATAVFIDVFMDGFLNNDRMAKLIKAARDGRDQYLDCQK